MIEQANRVCGVQCHRRWHARIVARFADTAIVEDHDLITIGEAACQMMVVIVAEGSPATHAEHGVALTEYLVVHVVIVDASDGHGVDASFLKVVFEGELDDLGHAEKGDEDQ